MGRTGQSHSGYSEPAAGQPPIAGDLPPVERDEVDIGLLSVVGTFIATVVLLIAILLQAWFYDWRAELTEGRSRPATDPQTALGQALLEQQEQINHYHWINREAGTRAIPIQRAMELVVRELAVDDVTDKK
ncbi:MAG: hypothetical protein ABSF26_11320 [Thermoguttaceae bacterium]|jgi:hypothetical protein